MGIVFAVKGNILGLPSLTFLLFLGCQQQGLCPAEVGQFGNNLGSCLKLGNLAAHA